MTMIMCLTLCKLPLPSDCLGMNVMSTRAGNKAPRRIRNHRIVQPPQLPQVCSDPGQVLYYLSAIDRKSTRLNSSHGYISYAVFCLKKKKTNTYKVVSLTTILFMRLTIN